LRNSLFAALLPSYMKFLRIGIAEVCDDSFGLSTSGNED